MPSSARGVISPPVIVKLLIPTDGSDAVVGSAAGRKNTPVTMDAQLGSVVEEHTKLHDDCATAPHFDAHPK